MKNKGAVSIEAAVAFPLFLFTMLALIYMTEIYTVKGVVYEGVIETAEYMAEYAYLTDCFEEAEVMDYPMAMLRFQEYADSKALLEKFIVGGSNGVSFLGSQFPDDEGYIDIYATYYIRVNAPIVGHFKKRVTEHIRQRAYLGDVYRTGSDEDENDGRYVYVAENGEVYHESRSCTYLMPSITSSDVETAKANGYRACTYCGGEGSIVFVTEDGECYHSSRSCSRLRRTVSRVKLSDTELPPCSKCSE